MQDFGSTESSIQLALSEILSISDCLSYAYSKVVHSFRLQSFSRSNEKYWWEDNNLKKDIEGK